MSKIIYEVVQHDGGWAYQAEGSYSETYPTRETALAAAKVAAEEQIMAGPDEEIEYEEVDATWKIEHADGHDRPKVKVVS